MRDALRIKPSNSPRILQQIAMAARHAIMATGINFYTHTHDRRLLETVIIPYFAHRAEFKKILFVGCAWYTSGYQRFFSEKEYWTLDSDPDKRRYGTKRHIVDSLSNVSAHFQPDELDLILCNGVFGWGLDVKADVEQAFQGCYECLRKGGVFMLGWNDIPSKRPFAPEESESLRLFSRYVFPPLQTARFLTATPYRHTYDFYSK